jgi:putative transposase
LNLVLNAHTKYTSASKTKLVLELLQNESTLVQIASKHNILPQNLQNWKKTFLANAEVVESGVF